MFLVLFKKVILNSLFREFLKMIQRLYCFSLKCEKDRLTAVLFGENRKVALK